MTRARAFAIGLAGIVATGMAACRPADRTAPADLVLRGGRIVTLDDRISEVEAVAARDGTIVFAGSRDGVEPFIGPSTEVLDVDGQFAMPGFIEGHGHFAGLGEARLILDLRNTQSWDEIVQLVAAAARKARPGEWISGRGWHQEKWSAPPRPEVEGFPVHQSLDRVSPDNPVVLTHASGHASFVNARAMALSNITRTTPDPAGGEILKDARGSPTGLLRETAADLVKEGTGERVTPEDVEARARRALLLADEEVTSKGITTFQDAGSSFAVIDRIKRLVDEGALRTRLWVMVREADNATLATRLDAMRVLGYGGNRLTVSAIKTYMDGALGSRGAWLLEPYSDDRSSVGLHEPVDAIRETARLALEHGYQLGVHAIGDRANREVLDVFEDAFRTAGKTGRDLRWRVEHAQHLSPADIPRFGRLGVIASMQMVHATSDAVFVPVRLGAVRSAEGAYVWRKLMTSGAVIAAGTDAPVEDVDPILNYYAAVTRRTADGTVFYADQKMSRMEALRAYTMGNAYAAFEDGLKGTISVGKLADITVLTKDITQVPDEEIRTAKVAYTIVGGRIVYRSAN